MLQKFLPLALELKRVFRSFFVAVIAFITEEKSKRNKEQ